LKRIAILLFTFISALSANCQTNLLDGDRCFDNGDYTCAVTKYNEIFKLTSGKDKQIAEIRLSRAKWCANHIKAANQAFTKNDYKTSKENYQSVLDTNPNDSYAKEQLVKCNNILNPPATTLTLSKENFSFPSSGGSESISVNTNADSYSINMLPTWCSAQKYAEHFVVTCNANSGRTIRTDYFSVTAGDKTVRINLMQSINIGIEQRYSEINLHDYNGFININFDAMNALIKNYRGKGEIRYSTLIQFDQQGINLSDIKIHSTSNNKYNTFLSSIKPYELPPSKISNIYIPTKETVTYNLSWETSIIKAVVKFRNIRVRNLQKIDSNQNSYIATYISHQNFKSGIYTFNSTKKILNDKSFSDLVLISFTNNSGPMNFLYSVLIPGLGTRKVTDGVKGKGRMALFLLSAGISAGSRIYSLNQQNEYLKDPAKGSTFYSNSDIANKVFIVSGGIAASVYLYDIFYVFGRGIKNLRENKSFKQGLSVRPVILDESPLKPENYE